MTDDVDPAFLAFLRRRLAEETSGPTVDPLHAERGLALVRELLVEIDSGRAPDRMSRDLLVAAYARHPEFRPEWNRWRRG